MAAQVDEAAVAALPDLATTDKDTATPEDINGGALCLDGVDLTMFDHRT